MAFDGHKRGQARPTSELERAQREAQEARAEAEAARAVAAADAEARRRGLDDGRTERMHALVLTALSAIRVGGRFDPVAAARAAAAEVTGGIAPAPTGRQPSEVLRPVRTVLDIQAERATYHRRLRELGLSDPSLPYVDLGKLGT